MACCGKKSNPMYDVQVTFPDGSSKTYATRQEARIAISGAGGGTMKYVKKTQAK